MRTRICRWEIMTKLSKQHFLNNTNPNPDTHDSSLEHTNLKIIDQDTRLQRLKVDNAHITNRDDLNTCSMHGNAHYTK